METYSTTIANLGTEIIPLGRAGETGYRAIAIDCSTWLATLPDGALALIFENPNGDVYAVQNTSISDGVLTWYLTDVDMQYNGIGAIQLNLMDEDVIAKSVIAKVNILPSLGIGGDVPTPAEDWLDHMIEAQQEAEYYAGQAEYFSGQAIAAEGRAELAMQTAIEAKDDAVIAKADAEYAAEKAERSLTHAPKIQGGTWWVWDAENEVYVDTHVQAQGPQGEQGIQGIPGQDGFSPSATVTQAGNVTTVTITDKDGTTSESIDLSEYAKVDGTYPNLLAGDLISDGKITDNKPYVSRVTDDGNEIVGKRSYPKIVGATVCWNQIAPSTVNDWGQNGYFKSVIMEGSKISLTPKDQNAIKRIYSPNSLIQNHIYFVSADYSGDEGNASLTIGFYTNTTDNTNRIYDTFSFGTPKSLRTLWKPTRIDQTIFGLSMTTGQRDDLTAVINNVMCIDITQMFGVAMADFVYAMEQNEAGSGIAWIKTYGFFAKDYYAYDAGSLQSVCVSAHKTFDANGNLFGNYPLDSTKEFRGLFKLDGNNDLYADGDEYQADGTVTRNYELRAYEAGDESLADAITDGTNTVVKLVTPTTESADPFTSPQIVEAGGTEEYVDALVTAGTRDVSIPIGHETEYLIGLRNLLETQLPPAPSADGTYTLKCTITGGVKTFSWEA